MKVKNQMRFHIMLDQGGKGGTTGVEETLMPCAIVGGAQGGAEPAKVGLLPKP